MIRKKGSALILMLAVISLLLVLSVSVLSVSSSSYKSNISYGEIIKYRNAAEAGIEKALAFVSSKGIPVSVNDFNADDGKITCKVTFTDNYDGYSRSSNTSKFTIVSKAYSSTNLSEPKKTITVVFNKTTSGGSSFFTEMINGCVNVRGDIVNSNDTIKWLWGSEAANIKGEIYLQGYSVDISKELIGSDKLTVVSNNDISFNYRFSGIEGPIFIQGENNIYMNSPTTTKDIFTVLAKRDIIFHDGAAVSVDKETYIRGGGNLTFNNDINVKGPASFIADNGNVYFHYNKTDNILGKTYIRSGNNIEVNSNNLTTGGDTSIIAGAKASFHNNNNLQINGSAYIRGNELDFKNYVNLKGSGDITIIGDNNIKSEWGKQFVFDNGKNISIISKFIKFLGLTANMGNAYIRADNEFDYTQSRINTAKLEAYINSYKNDYNGVLSPAATPVAKRPDPDPVPPLIPINEDHKKQPLNYIEELKAPYKNSPSTDNAQYDTRFPNIAFRKISGKNVTSEGDFYNKLYTSVYPQSGNLDNYYKVLFIDGDCDIEGWRIREAGSSSTNFTFNNYIIYCTGKLRIFNMDAMTLNNSIIYAKSLEISSVNRYSMTAIDSTPNRIPYTPEIEAGLKSYLGQYLVETPTATGSVGGGVETYVIDKYID